VKNLAPFVAIYSPAPGSGKSTLAQALINQGWVLVKFAGPLKAMMRALLREAGCPEELIERYVEGDLKEEPCPYLGGHTCRYGMQTLGTEWGRILMGDRFWVNITAMKTAALRQAGQPVVNDDMRFPNEFEFAEDEGATTVMLTRPGVDFKGGHASEGALDDRMFTLRLINDYSSPQEFVYAALTAVQGHAWRTGE
jgi:hypothetical protein